MRPLVSKFEYASESAHIMSFDWALSLRNLGLSTKMEVG
jgi:hypothetical protein